MAERVVNWVIKRELKEMSEKRFNEAQRELFRSGVMINVTRDEKALLLTANEVVVIGFLAPEEKED